jgi:cyclopropane-fatty-acyl-phospholipid synthase
MSTAALRAELASALPERPFTVEFWDGGTLPSTDGGPTFRVNGPAAIGHLLRAPGQLGLGRAYVSGMLEVDDLDAGLDLLDRWSPPPIERAARLRLMRAALRAHGLRLPPRRPAAELVPSGRRHSRARDARAVRHHYDVGNDFFRLFLDESMTYSCAFFSRVGEGGTLEEAQEAKLELVCAKLGLRPGETVLDVGCGWGSFAAYAAQRHGVNVVGITLSPEQAEYARRRIEGLGLGDRVEILQMDYREVPAAFGGRFDAIASIGMVEHVGELRIDGYAGALAGALKPGGRLLNHGIARLRHGDPEAGPFSERYVWPDAAPLHVSRVLLALERAGFVTAHVEGFADDYAVTLRHWLANLEARMPEALALAGPERLRVWRLYLRAARRTFESGFLGVYQVRSTLTGGRSAPQVELDLGVAEEPSRGRRFRRDGDAETLVTSHRESRRTSS